MFLEGVVASIDDVSAFVGSKEATLRMSAPRWLQDTFEFAGVDIGPILSSPILDGRMV